MKAELKMLKARLGEPLTPGENDELLSALLYEAENYILAYTRRNITQWLPFFDAYLIRLAALAYQNAGMEGIKSRKEGDISTDFTDAAGLHETVLKPLARYRLAVAAY
jgi:hypothetical protein